MKAKLPLFNLERLEPGFEGKAGGGWTKPAGAVYRAEVAGGWFIVGFGAIGLGGLAFYPDSRHSWTGGTLN
jgi:hypothetical protein